MQMGRPLPQTEDPYETLERLLHVEKYDVRRVDLSQQSSLPAEATTIVVVNPRNLSERQRWELNRALHEGKSVFLAVQKYRWNYNVVRKPCPSPNRKKNPR